LTFYFNMVKVLVKSFLFEQYIFNLHFSWLVVLRPTLGLQVGQALFIITNADTGLKYCPFWRSLWSVCIPMALVHYDLL
jgi:hypothetical protein